MPTIDIACTQAGDSPNVIIPTCLLGTCNGSVVPNCVCPPGWIHDRITGRYNNCALPDWIPYLGTSLSVVVTSIALIYGLYVVLFLSTVHTMAWRVAIASTASALMFLGASISLFVTTPVWEMPWYGAIFVNFGSAFTAYAVGIMVVLALAPVARFSKSKFGLKFFQTFMLVCLPGFIFVGCTLCTIVGYSLNDDQAVTDAMGAIYIVLTIASIVTCPIMWMHLHRFVRALDDALARSERMGIVPIAEDQLHSSDTPDSPDLTQVRQNTSSNRLRTLRTKVFRLMITSTVCAFAAFVVCLFCACSQFAARTVPFSWAVYYALIIALGIFSCQLSHSAITQRDGSRSRLSLLHGSRKSKMGSSGSPNF